MAQLVVGGICRFTLQGDNWSPWANILDFHINTAFGGSREDAIEDQAEIINQEWPTAWKPFWASTVNYFRCSWVDLDTESGSTGETSETSGALTLPTAGTATGEADPPNVAYLVHKRVPAGRARRAGRTYVAGVPEGMSSLQNVASSPLSSINTMLSSLLANLNQNAAPLSVGSYDSALAVVHAPAGGTPSFTEVSSLQCDQIFATQRRRLRG